MTPGRGSVRSGAVRSLSPDDARRMLVGWHFERQTLPGVFEKLGSIQYDPLRPMGTNVDLVLQARVPGYRVDTWQQSVYGERLAFDGWDKQASLVHMPTWPQRRIYHRWQRERWRERMFDRHPRIVQNVLAELVERGPLASSDFRDKRRSAALDGSWYGTSLTKHALRALWHAGLITTHHRRNGQHVYDLVERVVPPQLRAQPEPDEREQLRFLIAQRHRAVGLLRPNASREVWSLEISTAERDAIISDLVAECVLIAYDVDGTRYHAHRDVARMLDRSGPSPGTSGAVRRSEAADAMRFIAPLDPFVWDRAAVAELFGFSYVWEVYKPVKKRQWGYYVLPVLWRDRFVGRFDGRVAGETLEVHRLWLEPEVHVDARLTEALEASFGRFLTYLGVGSVRPNPSWRAVARPVRDALYRAARGESAAATAVPA